LIKKINGRKNKFTNVERRLTPKIISLTSGNSIFERRGLLLGFPFKVED